MCSTNLFSQSLQEIKNTFEDGKRFISEKKFKPAMNLLKQITVENNSSSYSPYAAYYYASAAYQNADYQEAIRMLNLLLNKSYDWNQLDESRYLLANVYLANAQYSDALHTFEKIKNTSFANDIISAKKSFFKKVDFEKLRDLYSAFPNEKTIAEALIFQLSNNTAKGKNENLLASLKQKYGFKLTAKKEVVVHYSSKDHYQVAAIFPFELAINDAFSMNRKSQFVYDLYEGMNIALKKLNEEGGKPIKLFAYDSEQSANKVDKLLGSQELNSTDLFFLGENLKAISNFSLKNKIPVVNPLSNTEEWTNGNDFQFLQFPSFKKQAQQAATFALDSFPQSTAYIFYGGTQRDSMMAHEYKRKIEEKQGKVKAFRKVIKSDRSTFNNLNSDLRGLTKDSNVHVFLATSEQTFAVNVLSAVQAYPFAIPMIVTPDWFSFQNIAYEQIDSRRVYIINPDYYDANGLNIKEFRELYQEKTNMIPSKYAYIGYETMYLFGKMLKTYGKDFREKLKQQGFVAGQLLYGADFSQSNDNQVVPILGIYEGIVKIVNFTE